MVPASARVYIQIKETGEIIQLDDFISVSSSVSLDSDSSATVNIMNKADKWYNFRSAKDRFQTDVSQFLLGVYQSPRVVEINRELQARTQEALQTTSVSSVNTLLGQISTLEQYLIFDLAYRVWIDYRGRDDLYDLQASPMYSKPGSSGKWYAGFTGIIGEIAESYSQGRDASIAITGNSMMRFFDNIMVVGDQAWDPSIRLSSDFLTQLSPFKSSFSEYVDGAAIILFLIEVIEKIFFPNGATGIYPGNGFWAVPGLQGPIGNIQQSILDRTYSGFSHLRQSGGIGGFYNDPMFLSDSFIDTAIKILPVRKSDIVKVLQNLNLSDSSVSPYMLSQFAVDILINAGDINGDINGMTTNPYQKLIKQGALNWEATRLAGSSVLKIIASLMNYHIFCDTSGNLIYQKARYDDFPNYLSGDYDDMTLDNSRGFAYIDAVTDNTKSLIQNIGGGVYDALVANGSVVLNPSLPSGFPRSGLECHGRNYIIGDESLKGWRIPSNDNGIITAAVLPPNLNYTSLSGQQAAQNAGSYIDLALQARFGTRLVNFPQVICDANVDPKILAVMANMRVIQNNSKLNMINMTFDTRPDLQVGRTCFFMPRRKMYYIDRIQNTVMWGQEDGFSTTVSGKYGHSPLEHIGDPWSLILNSSNPAWAPLGDNLDFADIINEIYNSVPSLFSLQSWQTD